MQRGGSRQSARRWSVLRQRKQRPRKRLKKASWSTKGLGARRKFPAGGMGRRGCDSERGGGAASPAAPRDHQGPGHSILGWRRKRRGRYGADHDRLKAGALHHLLVRSGHRRHARMRMRRTGARSGAGERSQRRGCGGEGGDGPADPATRAALRPSCRGEEAPDPADLGEEQEEPTDLEWGRAMVAENRRYGVAATAGVANGTGGSALATSAQLGSSVP